MHNSSSRRIHIESTMKWIVSRYNQDIDYIKDYTDDVVLYDRSEEPIEGSIVVPNIGTDWYDKFTYIIDNYDYLPNVALYTKANLFKYITPEEFEGVKDNRTFTPLFTKHHEEKPGICGYGSDGMYEEINNQWYLGAHPTKHNVNKLMTLLGIANQEYVKFAPGSSYIVPKGNILKHSIDTYIHLKDVLEWDRYPGEGMIIERGMYNFWK